MEEFKTYIAEMNSNVILKEYILSLIEKERCDSFLEIGSGGGVILDMISEKFPKSKVNGTEISQAMLDELYTKKKRIQSRWNVENFNILDSPYPERKDVIIFSSVLHEIFSYTDLGLGKFQKANVLLALENAKQSLNDSGVIAIRDGISNGKKSLMGIRPLKDERTFLVFLNKFLADFNGLKGVPKEYTKRDGVFFLPYELAREFLLTYTWGKDSYDREVKEQFGYFTKKDWYDTAKQIEMDIIFYKEISDDGYRNHIENDVALVDENMKPIAFPNTNVYVVMKNHPKQLSSLECGMAK